MDMSKFLNKLIIIGITLVVLTIISPVSSIYAYEPEWRPSIEISKQERGPDSRVFPSGADVPFEIVVTNTGERDLTDVEVTDTLVPDCNLLIGDLPIGASYNYTCTAPNVTVGFTNIADVIGIAGPHTVTDMDPSTVKIASIDIRKQEKGPDSRVFPSGADVPFEIEVTNTGEVDLTDVEVTDELVPDCARVIGDLAAGASFTYTCTASAVTEGFTNIAVVVGFVGEISVTDTDPSTVEIMPVDINIRKQEEGPDSRVFPSGADVPFEIEVTNNGEVDLTDVEVTDELVPDCDRVIGDLAVGASFTYTCTAPNVTEGFTNVAEVIGFVGEISVTDTDPSTVEIVPPGIDIRKQEEGPDSRVFPSGADVPFDIVVTNNTDVDLTDVEVTDELVPDCDRVIGDLAAGASFTYTCTASAVTEGFTNIAVVVGFVGEISVTDTDPSTVEIASIDIRKQEEGPDSREFPSGSDVPFDIVVTNDGEVDLTDVEVTDELVPDCNRVIGDLAVGASFTYTCTAPNVTEGFTNVAEVIGFVGEISVTDTDPSTVVIEPVYMIYLPLVSTAGIRNYDVSVGYEDLPLEEGNDFDYNDWVVSIDSEFVFTPTMDLQTVYLNRLSLTMVPMARGALLDHEFHLRFPADTFASDGIATLTIRDGDGNIIGGGQTPFVASQLNDYLIIEHTYDAIPPQGETTNTIELTGPIPTQRTAELVIEFDTATLFTFTDYDEHGDGLFFDPYIRVDHELFDEIYDVGIGDVRTLVFPFFDWAWPEERIRIDKAYPDIVYVGPQEMFEFPLYWWQNYNTCVYGDGIVCPEPDPLGWLEDFVWIP